MLPLHLQMLPQCFYFKNNAKLALFIEYFNPCSIIITYFEPPSLYKA